MSLLRSCCVLEADIVTENLELRLCGPQADLNCTLEGCRFLILGIVLFIMGRMGHNFRLIVYLRTEYKTPTSHAM